MDFNGMEEYDFDGKMDFDGMEEYDFDGKMDFDDIEEYNFDGKLDFDGMEESNEENRLEPTGESDISQEPDRDTNADNIDDQSSSTEQENESYENLNSESTSTVLICENREEEEGESLQSDDQGHEEKEEINQEEFDKEIEKELEEGVEAINQYLEEEAEFINAYQEMVGDARELDGEREREGEEFLKTEEEWEKEVETAAYTAEQLYESTNEIEVNANNEELSEISEDLEIEKEAEQSKEVLEPQLNDLQEEFEEGMNEIEQHQVDPLIEEALETEPESMINEKEIGQLQELDLEEQFNKVHEKEEMEELIEWQDEQIEQEKEEAVEAQTDNSEEIVSELEEDFEEGMNEIEQHQVDPLVEEALETEPEPMVNEKEIEQLQELELEEQYQTIEFNELIKDLVEKQEEEKTEQEKENSKQTQEILHQTTYIQEKLDEHEQELELEFEEKDEVEQHQVETAIEEELETEPKPILREEELEYVKNFEPEKQLEAELFYELIEKLKNKQEEGKEEREGKEEQEELSTEEKVAQIKRELGINQEIKSGDAEVENRQEEVLEHETISPDVSEQTKKSEQDVLNEIDSGEEESDKTAEENYEKLKKLYRQQTGKRPIYANLETKGFKQWLEQEKEAEKKEKTKQEQDLKEEQKKEEAWKRTLKNKIEEANEIEPELKSKLIKLVEKYNKLEELIKKYSQLHNKAQRKGLSQTERKKLNSLAEELLKLDPIKMELFLGIREIKRYIDKDDYYYYEYWNNQRNLKVFSHFFTQLSQKYSSLKQLQKKEKYTEKILKNWIEEVSEEEIEPFFKAELKIIVENYSELEKLAIRFMELNKKEQLKQISQSEKIEFNSLIKTLGKMDPNNIELFANIRAIKHYLYDQHLGNSSEENRVYQILTRFFTISSQKYKNLTFNKQNTDYHFPVLRKKINKKYLDVVWKELRNSGVTLKYLNKKLGITFKSLLSSGHSISNDVYEILNNIAKSIMTPQTFYDLFGQNTLPFIITVGKSGKEIKVLDDSDLTDEFLAIMSGDGTLLTNGQTFGIALNSIDEERYVKYVRKLMEILFPNAIIHEVNTKGKGVILQINDISYHYALVCKGLIPGDKVKNQIRVPKINILNNKNLNKWLKGLFDTDGTVYVKRRGMSIVLGFTSGSKQLVKNFKSICEILGIESSSSIAESNYKSKITGKESIIYSVFIYKKESIKRFIQIVDPEKFKEPMRRLYIGSKLILRRSPKIIRQDVENRIKTLVPENKKRRYSKLYALLLRKTIEESYREILNKKKFLITNKMIEKALHDVTQEKALSHYIKIENKKIRQFPSEIRNKICGMISKNFDMKITDEEEILKALTRIFKNSENNKLFELNELLNDKIIGKILKQYVSVLIGLVREIRKKSELGNIHVYTISRDFDINPKILISIIENLKKKKYIQYDKPIVQKQPSKTSTELYLEKKIIIDNYIIKLRNKGLAYREISKEAKKKFGFDITYWRVSKVIEGNLSKND